MAGATVIRLAALCDIHAKLPALGAVLAEVRRASLDRLVIGGGVVPCLAPGACWASTGGVGTQTASAICQGEAGRGGGGAARLGLADQIAGGIVPFQAAGQESSSAAVRSPTRD